MSWKYILLKRDDGKSQWWEVHQAYLDKKGRITELNEEVEGFSAELRAEIFHLLSAVKDDISQPQNQMTEEEVRKQIEEAKGAK